MYHSSCDISLHVRCRSWANAALCLSVPLQYKDIPPHGKLQTCFQLLRWTVTSTVSGRNYPNHRDSLQNQRQSRYSLFIRDLIFSRHLWGGIKQFLFGVSCGREQARNYFFYLLYVEIITLRSFKLFYVKINFWSLEYTSAVLLITIHDWIIFQGYCKNFQK